MIMLISPSVLLLHLNLLNVNSSYFWYQSCWVSFWHPVFRFAKLDYLTFIFDWVTNFIPFIIILLFAHCLPFSSWYIMIFYAIFYHLFPYLYCNFQYTLIFIISIITYYYVWYFLIRHSHSYLSFPYFNLLTYSHFKLLTIFIIICFIVHYFTHCVVLYLIII